MTSFHGRQVYRPMICSASGFAWPRSCKIILISLAVTWVQSPSDFFAAQPEFS